MVLTTKENVSWFYFDHDHKNNIQKYIEHLISAKLPKIRLDMLFLVKSFAQSTSHILTQLLKDEHDQINTDTETQSKTNNLDYLNGLYEKKKKKSLTEEKDSKYFSLELIGVPE